MAGEMSSLSTSSQIPGHVTIILCTMCASILHQKAGSEKRTDAARERLRNWMRQVQQIIHGMMAKLKCHCERSAAV